ncbi:methyltransferase domain-containing protein [Patescibacteria group bacterium]|nr:methyltransferase domain-containing protein [Patescibacteria group bacterium]
MSQELDIRSKLEQENIFLTERLGQHMLIDGRILDMVVNQVSEGSNVLEVGSGPGNLTKRIASRAKKVVGIEIDPKFQPLLNEIESAHPNVEIVYGDVLSVNFGKIIKSRSEETVWQIVSNLPFHISEPFLSQIADLPIENAILIVGEQLANRMQIDDPYNGPQKLDHMLR